MFALLDEVGNDPERLAPVWSRLAILLEVHADAEEQLFYPRLLRVGQGADGAEDAPEETEDALRDHNDIREAIRRVDGQRAGSEGWWQGVRAAREANSDHMAEEEREALADFRQHASLEQRHSLGVEFAVFEAVHASGVRPQDTDVAAYIEENAPEH
jgi:hypothetical protein